MGILHAAQTLAVTLGSALVFMFFINYSMLFNISIHDQEGTMTVERRGLARVLKVGVNVIFLLTLLGSLVMTVMWPLSGLSDRTGFDLTLPVVIGEGSFPAIHQLEVSAKALAEDLHPLTGPRLVNAQGELRVSGTMIGFSMTLWVIMVLGFAAILLGLQFLRKILETTVEGRPFDARNIRRLNYLGLLITTSGIVFPLVEFFATRWILQRYAFTPLPLSAPVQVRSEWIVCGLLVLVLAAVWKEAVRMAEDQSFTV